MKSKLFTLIFTLLSFVAFSQNGLKARIEYEAAEESFATENYSDAVSYLIKAENLLGVWNSKLGYMMIVSLDKILDYGKPNKDVLIRIRNNIDLYLKEAENNKGLSMDKVRNVLAIEKMVEPVEKRILYETDPNYVKGLNAYKINLLDESLSYFNESSAKGNALASAFIGHVYFKKGEFGKAMEIYNAEAKLNNSNVMSRLGSIYCLGDPDAKIEKDIEKGIQWYIKAADMGDIEAANLLSLNFGYGRLGFPRKTMESLKWAKFSAEKGSAEGCFKLASLLEDHEKDKINEAEVVKYYKLAAEKGSVQGMHCYAVKLWLGEKDCEQALQWFERSINHFHNLTSMYLSVLAETGCGGIKENKDRFNELVKKFEMDNNKK